MSNIKTLAAAAAIAAASISSASAAAMDNDPNTGLWSYIYYGPIADLQRQGLPIKSEAAQYVRQYNSGRVQSAAPATARAKRGNVYLLEDRSGITGTNGLAPVPNVDDKQSGHLW